MVIVTHCEKMARAASRRSHPAGWKFRHMSDPATTVPKIRDLVLFAEFTESELEALADLVDCATHQAGEHLVKQDDPGESMFIIISGSATVVHHAGGREFELATLKRGDFFGEIALVDQGPRSADVVAGETTETLDISQATIRALAGVYPSASFKLLVAVGRVLVARLRMGNKKYIDTLLMASEG